jgi:hypothetical protein
MNATGNDAIEFPPIHWEYMVKYFRGRAGLWGEVLGSSSSEIGGNESEVEDESPICDILDTIERNESSATPKNKKSNDDIGDAIMKMGESVGNGLRCLGAKSDADPLYRLSELITKNHSTDTQLREKELEEQKLFRETFLTLLGGNNKPS